jgi:hypothetical protein
MADVDTRELARGYLTSAQQAESAAPSAGGVPKADKPAAAVAPQAGKDAGPVDTRALARDYLSAGQPGSFTEAPKPAAEGSTLGKVAGSVYGATLGPLVQRAQEGGKQIADVLVPGPGSARQVPSRYSGTSDAVRSRMERPGVWQDVKDVAGGALKIASSPLAPLGEAARPGVNSLGARLAPQTSRSAPSWPASSLRRCG